MAAELSRVSVGDLNRTPGLILDRVLRGERFIVCRHRRPIATLQPLGSVVQPFEGREYDINGLPLGDASAELAKLSGAQHALLMDGIRFGRFVPGLAEVRHPYKWEELCEGIPDLIVRGLARRKPGRGVVLTGRGAVLREALLARAGRDDLLFGVAN